MLILFDLDDTLFDHAFAFDAATTALHAAHGSSRAREDFAERWSMSHRQNFDRYLLGEMTFEAHRRARVRDAIDATLGDAEADHVFATYLSAYESSWRLFDDVVPCLNGLTGLELGIVTNGELEQQRNKLARCGIEDRFEHVIVPASCGYAKPHAQIFAEACRRFGCRPAEAVYVGDSYALDAQAARAAGLRGVWLDRLRVADASHEGPIIEKLDVLAALLGLGSDA